jgi:hypothetical protein
MELGENERCGICHDLNEMNGVLPQTARDLKSVRSNSARAAEVALNLSASIRPNPQGHLGGDVLQRPHLDVCRTHPGLDPSAVRWCGER